MSMRLKTKLTLGLVFLFVVILSFGILGIFYINRLSTDARLILKDNHVTLSYSNNMLKALENMPAVYAMNDFERNLRWQENNITEGGESEATHIVRENFEKLKKGSTDPGVYKNIRNAIYRIEGMNQQAIINKNKIASHTADQATLWLTVIVTVLTIVAFTFIVNFPGIISGPIKALSEGIRAISAKNYSARIHITSHDEFGELATAFNEMAEKLDEYEHSNLARIMFEKSRIEAIIDQMKDGIIGFDQKGNLLFMNVVAENLFGLKEADLMGSYGPDIALQNDLMRSVLQHQENKRLKIYADGKESYFMKELINVQHNGQIIGNVIVLRNVTIFHELAEAKTNFIATVSHELKTPIASIKMSLKLLNDDRVGTLQQEQKDLIRSISDDIERLLAITGELLNMAQVEAGNLQLNMQSIPPQDIVQNAVNAVQSQVQQKKIVLQYNGIKDVGPVHADGEKTSWVLINYLTNAIKYSYEHGLIQLSVRKKNGYVEFEVQDHGVGIEEKYLSRIFDRYFKVPGDAGVNGTGLGLAISKEFIEAQHGRVWVNSKYGEGTSFGFSLPVAS